MSRKHSSDSQSVSAGFNLGNFVCLCSCIFILAFEFQTLTVKMFFSIQVSNSAKHYLVRGFGKIASILDVKRSISVCFCFQ